MTELEQINAIAGLCYKMEGWSDALRQLGYVVDRIELKFSVVDEDGKSRSINPDIVLVSDTKNSSIFFELKSGTIQSEYPDQLRRYSLVKKEDVIQKAHVTSPNPGSHIFSIVLLCNEEHRQDYKNLLNREKYTHALVTIGDTKIQLIDNSIKESYANEVFRQGVSIENLYPPLNLIPILPTSNDVEIAKRAIDVVISLLVKKRKHFTVEQLAEGIFYEGLWQAFDTEAKSRLRDRIRAILKEMSNTEFSAYTSRRGGRNQNPEEWSLSRHPSDRRTTQYQRLKKIKIDYISRLSRGELYKGYSPNQESLFAQLEETGEF